MPEASVDWSWRLEGWTAALRHSCEYGGANLELRQIPAELVRIIQRRYIKASPGSRWIRRVRIGIRGRVALRLRQVSRLFAVLKIMQQGICFRGGNIGVLMEVPATVER